MVIALLIGTILGFFIAIPPGPVGVTVAKYSVFNTRNQAYTFALASGLMDMIFALSAAFAASAISRGLKSFSDNHLLLMNLLQILIVFVFILYGIFVIYRSRKISAENDETSYRNRFTEKLANRGPFILGLAISISNLANPSFLPALGYISLQVESFNFFHMTPLTKMIYAVGFGLGNFLWLYLMSTMVSMHKHRLSANFRQRLYQFAGLTFVGFGTFLGYRLFTFVHWQELLRLAFIF